MDTTELLASVGGPPGIARIVDELYRRLLADVVVGPYFDGVALDGVRRHMGDFLISALGGRQQYRGRDLQTAHAGLDVTDDAFDRTVSHLLDCLQVQGMSPEQIDRVVLELAALRPLITTAAGD